MTKNRIARPGSLNIFIEFMTHYCQIVFGNDFQFHHTLTSIEYYHFLIAFCYFNV